MSDSLTHDFSSIFPKDGQWHAAVIQRDMHGTTATIDGKVHKMTDPFDSGILRPDPYSDVVVVSESPSQGATG